MRPGARDALVAHAMQEPPCESASGNRRCRGDVDEWTEHERPLVHPRMRHRESRHVHAAASVEQEIEIERARGVAPRLEVAAPSRATLDRVQRVEQRPRAQRRSDLDDGVDVVGLRRLADDRRPALPRPAVSRCL